MVYCFLSVDALGQKASSRREKSAACFQVDVTSASNQGKFSSTELLDHFY